MSTQKSEPELLRCSFCNKDQTDVRKLIAGPTVFICDECIEVCNDIIAEDDGRSARRARASSPEHLSAAVRKALDEAAERLHPVVAHRVPSIRDYGDCDYAVVAAFTSLEAAVRAATGGEIYACGAELMHRAFDARNGPLADRETAVPEREAVMQLMAGAINLFKVPRRNGHVDDVIEGVEALGLASLLLRMVDRAARFREERTNA